ncbi:hypothetical protein GNY06_06165 [Elizabethkingia argentiflava]|uniref:Uncharacterized protein n=1 Tax=Elizabethkingia argenteiflava TaxID=2681556 RepID=A0A845PY17_9FLAO|nr:hypothetical protein [Elizabethkingia argenteiflava]NAW50970.1 hypothetical protein [Elizabethkingia argenteiflava]
MVTLFPPTKITDATIPDMVIVPGGGWNNKASNKEVRSEKQKKQLPKVLWDL